MNRLIYMPFFLLLASFASILVDEDVVNSWKNVTVEELDTHSFFITVPMIRSNTNPGIEVRNYRNYRTSNQCNVSKNGGYTSYNVFANCTQTESGCNNIFYIKNDVVIEYRLVGNCYTVQSLRPEYRFQ